MTMDDSDNGFSLYNLKKMPYSLDAEKGFLSSALHNLSIFDIHADSLKESLFFTRQHKVIFRALLSLWKEGMPADIITLGDWLEKNSLMDEAGGHPYIAELFIFLPTSGNHEEYHAILKEKLTARLAIAGAERIIEAAYNPAMGGDLSEAVQKTLVSVAQEAESGTKIVSIGEAAARRIDEYQSIFQNRGKLDGITTGFPSLDELSGGMKPGQLLVIGAKTKGGKSSLAINIAKNAANAGSPVGIFSLEMGASEIVDRLVASIASVDVGCLSKNPSEGDMKKISFGIGQSSILPIFIRDETDMNPLQMRAAARRMVAVHGVKLIVLDYIQLCSPTDRKASREQQVAEISRTLKLLAKELKITILALCQLNADGEARESRSIQMDCDGFWVIEYDEENNEYSLNIKLARSHARGRIPLNFQPSFLRFDEKTNNNNAIRQY